MLPGFLDEDTGGGELEGADRTVLRELLAEREDLIDL